MRMMIDVREACRERKTGKALWTLRLTQELLLRGADLHLLSDCPVPRAWTAALPPDRVTVLPEHGLRWHLAAARFARAEKPDLYVSPTSYIVPWLLGKRVKVLLVVHDLIAFRGEPHDRKATIIERLLLGRALRSAAGVCTVSAATRDDLLTRFPWFPHARVQPVFAGPTNIQPSPNKPDHRTIFCLGTLCPRKNQHRLIQAFARLPENIRSTHRLLLAGCRGWHDDAILELANATPGVEWLDHVSDESIDRLFADATIFALPSLYEGFGIPVLDAIQRGVPTLTSDRGSLREVAGDAALIVDPESVDAITEGLRQLLTDPKVRARLRQSGRSHAVRFSWKSTADLVLRSADSALH